MHRPALLPALAAALGGCTVITVTSAVVGTGVTAASGAVDATVAVGKAALKADQAALEPAAQ